MTNAEPKAWLTKQDGLFDLETIRLDLSQYDFIARLFGNLYAHFDECYKLPRQSNNEWIQQHRTT